MQRGQRRLRRFVQHLQQRFGRPRRAALALLPIADGVQGNVYTLGEFSLVESQAAAHTACELGGVRHGFGIVLRLLPGQVFLSGGIHSARVDAAYRFGCWVTHVNLKDPNGSGVLGHEVDDVRGGSGDSNPASSIQSQQAHLRSKSRAALTIGLAQPGVRRKSCSASG